MTTVKLTGKASRIDTIDRYRGRVYITFKTITMQDATKMYNDFIRNIKNKIPVERESDPYYVVSIGSLSIVSATEQLRKAFRKCNESSIFTKAVVNFDCEADNNIIGAILSVCEEFTGDKQESKWRVPKTDNEVIYTLSKNVYMSENKIEHIKSELMHDAIKDGYCRLSYILNGINSYSGIQSNGVPMAPKYKEIRLVDVSTPNLTDSYRDTGFVSRSARNTSIDSMSLFTNDSTDDYMIEELSDNKITLFMELNMIFEIDY